MKKQQITDITNSCVELVKEYGAKGTGAISLLYLSKGYLESAGLSYMPFEVFNECMKYKEYGERYRD